MRKTKVSIVLFSVFILMFLISKVTPLAYGWGVKKNERNLPPDVGIYSDEISGTNSFYLGDINKKEIYLTFDAGYDNGVLDKILDVLKEKDVKSTFFVTGDFLTRQEELAKRIVKEGHIIGNHTFNHVNITKASNEKIRDEIEKLENKYYEIFNEPMIKYFRPPEGEFNKASLEFVKSLGYKTFFWSLAYKDWDVNHQQGKEYAYNSIMENIHNGAIILLHTVSKDNLDALPLVIDKLKSEGYEIKNLNEMSIN